MLAMNSTPPARASVCPTPARTVERTPIPRKLTHAPAPPATTCATSIRSDRHERRAKTGTIRMLTPYIIIAMPPSIARCTAARHHDGAVVVIPAAIALTASAMGAVVSVIATSLLYISLRSWRARRTPLARGFPEPGTTIDSRPELGDEDRNGDDLKGRGQPQHRQRRIAGTSGPFQRLRKHATGKSAVQAQHTDDAPSLAVSERHRRAPLARKQPVGYSKRELQEPSNEEDV